MSKFLYLPARAFDLEFHRPLRSQAEFEETTRLLQVLPEPSLRAFGDIADESDFDRAMLGHFELARRGSAAHELSAVHEKFRTVVLKRILGSHRCVAKGFLEVLRRPIEAHNVVGV